MGRLGTGIVILALIIQVGREALTELSVYSGGETIPGPAPVF